MVSGSSSAEALIPGNAAVIAGALENVGAGIGAVRSIGEAWPMLRIPSWVGQGATVWASFVPREGARFVEAPAAFAKVAAALARYQSAFLQARAEVQSAIEQARAAEQATAQAVNDHRTAVRKAALADPGTSGAVTPVYRDPGAAGLANAQSRVAAARLQLNIVGTEVASVIYSAAASVSGVPPEITDDGWDAFWNSPFGGNPLLKLFPEVNETVGDFFKGFISAGWDTVVGLSELIQAVDPAQRLLRDLRTLVFEGPDGVFRRYAQDTETLIAVGSDPLGALREIWRSVSAEDLWAEHPAEATGRVTFEIASLVIPVAKIAKFSKLGAAGRAGTVADELTLRTLKPGEAPRIGVVARGSSDGGPGLWAKSPKRTKGVEYQEFVTRMEGGTEYKVNGIFFDGYDQSRKVLLDAKHWDNYPPAGTDFWYSGTLKEIRDQLNATRGTDTRIEWHLSSQSAKDAVDLLLEEKGLLGEITTVYTPFK